MLFFPPTSLSVERRVHKSLALKLPWCLKISCWQQDFQDKFYLNSATSHVYSGMDQQYFPLEYICLTMYQQFVEGTKIFVSYSTLQIHKDRCI